MKSISINKETSKFGFFLIPDKKTKDFIISWKDKVKSLEPDATYISHPVHSTVFLFNSEDYKIKEIIKLFEFKNIKIGLIDWFVFENDLATKEKNTLVIKIEKTKKLIELQRLIVNQLEKFIIGKVDYINNWSGIFKISYEKYGYPFVGNHWVPHITIASLTDKNILNLALATKIPFEKKINFKLALYKIKGEIHQCIHEW